MHYLRITDNTFGFYTDQIHEIKDTDISISDQDYDDFFKIEASGKQFRVKPFDENAKGLFDFVEEFLPEIQPREEKIDIVKELALLKERVTFLEDAMSGGNNVSNT